MKCCNKEMYDNGNNYRCGVCGNRIPKPKKCPKCGAKLYDNGANVHCGKCNFRKYLKAK